MKSVKGKRVLVTGAAMGMGRLFVERAKPNKYKETEESAGKGKARYAICGKAYSSGKN